MGIKFDLTKDTKEEITVEVFDEDIGKDDRLGDTKIPVREIIQQRNIVNNWIPLKNCKSGEVLFSAEYVELDSKPLPEPAVTKAQPTKPSEPAEKVAVPVAVKKDIPTEPLLAGSMKLTLHKARKLKKKGAFGKADPYTVLTVGKEKFKTATVSNNQNPEWNHTITFDLTKDTEEEMTVEVFDSDIGKDDRLGDTKISLREICHQRNVVNKWILLQNCKTGEVLFSAEYFEPGSLPLQVTPVPKVETRKTPEKVEVAKPVKAEKKEKTPEPVAKPEAQTPVVQLEPLPAGSINLTLHKARKLEKKGAFGKPDPYTILSVGKEKFKTATVKNNQNPEWQYTIKFDLTKDTKEEIAVEVFDEDIGKDDRLGDTKIPLREIIQQRNIVNKWIPLKNCKSGEVLFSAEYFEPGSLPLQVTPVPKVETRKTPEKVEVVKPVKAEKKEKTPEPVAKYS